MKKKVVRKISHLGKRKTDLRANALLLLFIIVVIALALVGTQVLRHSSEAKLNAVDIKVAC
jgi:hypothetical protein